MSDLLILIYILISLAIGMPCLYKGFVLKKKTPRSRTWKILLFLGALFTFVIPGIIILLYFYSRTAVTCYIAVANSLGITSTGIVVRERLAKKFLKENKISSSVYEKIKKHYSG